MTNLTLPPPAGQPNDPPATFDAKMYALDAWHSTNVSEMNALLPSIDAAGAYAATASAASASALALVNYKGEWAALTGALSFPASFSYGGDLYMLLANVANITAHVPGVSINIGKIEYTQSLELISTVYAAAAATVEWTNFAALATDYAELRLVGDGIYASAGSNTLKAKIRQNNAWQTSTTRGVGVNSTAQSDLTKSAGLGALAATAISEVIEVQALGLITSVPMAFRTHPYAGGELCSGEIFHSATPTTPVQGLQLYATTGTLTGTFRLYGVRK